MSTHVSKAGCHSVDLVGFITAPPIEHDLMRLHCHLMVHGGITEAWMTILPLKGPMTWGKIDHGFKARKTVSS